MVGTCRGGRWPEIIPFEPDPDNAGEGSHGYV